MAHSPITVKTRDEREIQVPIPATLSDTSTLAQFVSKAHADGYALVGASQVQSGDQRDPYVVGLKMTFERSNPAQRSDAIGFGAYDR